MESMELFVPLCHDLMIVSITLQLMLIAVLLLYKLWRAFLHWRRGVAFSATLVPTLEQLVPLPHPNPVLVWAVEWDLDIRTMVEDLKNEGPSAAERYCQNEAFMLKLRKIVRNVVSKNEMMRITQEVMMKQEVEKFHSGFRKSAEEEAEDLRAFEAMMNQIQGPPANHAIAAGAAQQWQQKTAAALEEDDEKALQEMLAVMNRKPGEEHGAAPATPSAPVLPVPPEPTRAAAAELDDEDAKALREMMAEADGVSEPVVAPVPAPAPAPMPEEDAKALEELLAVMNRKPHEANGATASAPPVAPVLTVPSAAPAASVLDEDDAKALQEMMAVMNRKPHEANGASVPAPATMSSPKAIEVWEDVSEQSDDTADLWAQMEELEDQGASLEEQARKFVSLCMPKGKLSSRDEKEATAHFFIGEAFDDAEEEQFDSFWLALDEDLCRGAEIEPQVQKLLDCFKVPKGRPRVSAQQHFYIGDEVEVSEGTARQGTAQQFYIGDEDAPEMSLP